MYNTEFEFSLSFFNILKLFVVICNFYCKFRIVVVILLICNRKSKFETLYFRSYFGGPKCSQNLNELDNLKTSYA